MSRVAVWMPVYNEERHLRAALESVLAQRYQDFTLYVSDNHSTDGSSAIIAALATRTVGPRIVVLQPPQHLAGIQHMKFLWDHLTTEGGHAYSIHIGGHDLWQPEHLMVLVERMDRDIASLARVGRTVAITYTDSVSIDDAGVVVHQAKDVMQIDQMGPAIIPQFVITGVRSSHLFGMWNEVVRRRLPIRHCCSGWDHLIVAEAALQGAILFAGGTTLKMRLPPPGSDMQKYGKRHLSEDVLAAATLDFRNQLEWCVHLVDGALQSLPAPAQTTDRELLTASMVSMYFVLRGYNLLAVPGASQVFSADVRVQQILLASRHIDQQVRLLVDPEQSSP